MERQCVVLSRIRYLRLVRQLREAGYIDETYVHTSHAVPKCWQNSSTGLKIPFSKGNLRIVELYDPWVCTIITIWVRPLVRPLAVREIVHSSWPHSKFWSHFACICHSLTTGMLKHFLWKGVSFKLANIQRLPCILLSADFTLHKIDLFYVLNMLNLYFQVKEWSYSMLGTMRDSYPTHEKIILLPILK